MFVSTRKPHDCGKCGAPVVLEMEVDSYGKHHNYGIFCECGNYFITKQEGFGLETKRDNYECICKTIDEWDKRQYNIIREKANLLTKEFNASDSEKNAKEPKD